MNKLPDHRQRGMCKYSLTEILVISLFAVLSDANDAVEIASYGKKKIEFLRTFLPNLQQIPSHDTIERTFQHLDVKAFSEILIACSEIVLSYEGDYLVNIDGKVLRGTARKSSKDGKKVRKNDGIGILTAWANKERVVLGQQRIASKTNEKTAIPQLIRCMDIEHSIVSIDAVLCTPVLAALIIAKLGHYILSVKGGNKKLLAQLTTHFEQEHTDGFEVNKQTDYVGGRIEQRRCTLSKQVELLDQTHAYKNCRTVLKIDTTREINKGGEFHKETQTRYYISDLDKDAAQFNELIRGHWGIENNLHWMLDVVFREDNCRVRKGNAPENLNTLRKIALEILINAPDKNSLKVKRKNAAWDEQYALDSVQNFFKKTKNNSVMEAS
ncbi:MAG: ISAs1 family transposase [Saprospiraceae bacterium]|nr:ISAs1 family transposase [Saprospiraceae bacterium]